MEDIVFLDIDGNKVFALSFGTGPRTILAHSGWIGNFEDWIATLAVLSTTWRTVVYDHRGAGETSVPVEKISPEALVDDVFRVMDALQLQRCVLAGFSRGTITVMRAALREPTRFDGLILMNGYGEVIAPGMTTPKRLPPSQWPGDTYRERLAWFAERCTPEADSDHIKRWATNLLSRATPEAADQLFMMQASEQIDWPERLSALTVPTLLLHGERDVFYRTEGMAYTQSLIPNSKLVVMQGSGHLPSMTRPEDVAREINAFFADCKQL